MGNIPPLEFISVAEQTGQIVQISDWTIHEVCRQLRLWDRAGLVPVKIAINLSPVQLRQPDFVGHVSRILSSESVGPERIMFEITESVAIQDVAMVAQIIHQFQEAGFDIAIDDFGTGYSSMAYLQQFRVRQLKIDRLFTLELNGNGTEGEAIVAKMIELGHSLGMTVVAEGVETDFQYDKLKKLECDEIQGYLMSKPLTPRDFEEFARQQTQSPDETAMNLSALRALGTSLDTEGLLA
jgi:EAL domain-containing protein (putative c-di-GMP-specific phosphodiesterase class I)